MGKNNQPNPISQPGPQTDFVSDYSDIVIYGGAAGGGKSMGLLIDPLKWVREYPLFRGVLFRRTYPQITGGGGLWDKAMEIYPRLNGKLNISDKSVTFPNGARIEFRHLQHEKNIYDWQGAEIPWFGFDEATHFTEKQFFYLLSRNRSTSGAPPRVRLTCNPDAESWVAKFISWWINQDTGYPIPERSGVGRWFYRVDDVTYWYDTERKAKKNHPDLAAIGPPKLATFIPATLDDNKELLRKDPGYKANLLAQSTVERERLLGGNWKITAADGLFRPNWFKIESRPPTDLLPAVRAWDLAATEQKDQNDPDYVAGVKMAKDTSGRFWILDVRRDRLSPLGVENLVKKTAELDGISTTIIMEQEGGASGKMVVAAFVRMLAGYTARAVEPDGDKVARATPYAVQAEYGNVYLVRAQWNDAFLSEHGKFPYGAHDDQVDAAAYAFRQLAKPPRSWEVK